jgi:ADP-ribose pyrophosphatase YjhB (NUDIX family)
MGDTNMSSCVLARRLDGRVLVVSRKDGSGFGLPGGKMEEGETPKIAACRELHEETSGFATPGRLMLLYRGVSPTSPTKRLVHLYYAHKITNALSAKEYGTTLGWFDYDMLQNASPFAPFYKEALPDGWDHLRPTEFHIL